ncbi:MAG TPA: 4-hydroxy-3-methylbut-2-enyl diphosphate reductase, partial [Methylocella sp.]|nr:4-hydroxy-3-methylbut-2-enyl diphosphate reductase [Methylocella sp.]
NRLREIGAEASIPAFLIADKSELDFAALREAGTIGLTAGASAPEILVEEVLEALSVLGPIELATLPGVEENIEFKLPAELSN